MDKTMKIICFNYFENDTDSSELISKTLLEMDLNIIRFN